MNRYFFGHHKCATNWLLRYSKDLANHFGWRFEQLNGGAPSCDNPSGNETFVFYWNTWWADARSITPSDRAVHLIRDPRDALVSGYYSWKTSHTQNPDRILTVRAQLQKLPLEEGLLLMVDHVTSLEQLEGWQWDQCTPQILTVRYEELLAEPVATLQGMLDHWQITLEPAAVEQLVQRHSFYSITGRQEGQENSTHHFRKGIAGDWKNHFTSAVKERFKATHGRALIALGYEKSDDW